MADRSDDAQSQLYLLRVWTTPGADGTPAWQGKLQPLLSAHSYTFASLPELFVLLHTLPAVTAGSWPGSDPPAQPQGSEE